MVLEKGFAWKGETYGSLSQIAKAMTGTSWNGHRFFGLQTAKSGPSAGAGRRERTNDSNAPMDAASIVPIPDSPVRCRHASLDDARAPAGEIAVAHPEGTVRTCSRRRWLNSSVMLAASPSDLQNQPQSSSDANGGVWRVELPLIQPPSGFLDDQLAPEPATV